MVQVNQGTLFLYSKENDMNKKHQKHVNEVFLYIHNRIMANVDPMLIKEEVITKFSVELVFFDVKPEMFENFVEELCLQAYFYVNKVIYGDEDCV